MNGSRFESGKIVGLRTVPAARKATGFMLAAYTICYFLFALSRAAKQPLWLDEVSTLWMCRLPDSWHVWSVLVAGAPDTAPPAFYAISRALLDLTGNDRIGIRLLPVIGFYVAQAAIFLFTRARLGGALGLFAMMIPVATGGLHYATDGRPYAAVLGAFAMGAWFWQCCGKDAGWRSAAGMWWSLSVAVALHFFAVLILIPISAAELTRTMRDRKISWRCWFAILASTFPLFIYLPLISRLRSFTLAAASAPSYYARPTPEALIDAYQQLFAPPGWGMLMACSAVLLLAARFVWASSKELPERGRFSVSEGVLGISLVLFPVVVFAFARLFTNTFHVRYTLPALFGYSAIAAWLVSLLPRRALLARVLSSLLLSVMVLASIREIRHKPGTHDIGVLQTVREDLPIVVSEGLQFIELRQNAPPRLRDRLVYLTTPSDVPNPDPTNENIVKNWAAIYPLPVYRAQDFLAGHRLFMLYHSGASSQTMTDWMAKSGWNMAVVGHQGDQWVFLVSQAK